MLVIFDVHASLRLFEAVTVLLSHLYLLTDCITLLPKCEVSSLSESPEEEEMDTPEEERKDLWSSETGSEGTPLSPSSPFLSTTEAWPESPRKRTQTLPSLSCPPVGKTGREPSWERWSRFPESFNENEEKTLSEDIFKLLDFQKVTLFSGVQKNEKEGQVEGQKDTENKGLHKTASDVVDKPVDATKTQAQSTMPLPKPRQSLEVNPAAVSREKSAAPTAPAVQKNNAPQSENTDSTNIINRYGPIQVCSLFVMLRVRDLNKQTLGIDFCMP